MSMLLTKSDMFLIGPIADLFGVIMNWIYSFLDNTFGIQNIGLCIILFTLMTNLLMIPLTVRQQKFTRISSRMNPEIQAIQKKYKNKKDQDSMMKMQAEQRAVQEKYGVSTMGGCLPSLIQLPMVLALYQVVQKVPAYVHNVKTVYEGLATSIMAQDGFQKIMEGIGKNAPVNISPDKFDYTKVDTIIDVLYKFQSATWDKLIDSFPAISTVIDTTVESISRFNNFLGINIAEAPANNWKSVAILIPILAGLTQYLSVRLMTSRNQKTVDDDNPMANSMNSMNKIMPIFSVFLCFTVPVGVGLYWITGAVIRSIQQIIVNKHLDKIDLDELVEKNKEKAAKKREKKGLGASKPSSDPDIKTLSDKARVNVRKIEEPKKKIDIQTSVESAVETEVKDSNKNKKSKSENTGSLSSKANMVKKFNESNK